MLCAQVFIVFFEVLICYMQYFPFYTYVWLKKPQLLLVSANSKELYKLSIQVKDEKNPKIKHKQKLVEESIAILEGMICISLQGSKGKQEKYLNYCLMGYL